MPKTYVYGGSFYPPGVHHEAIARVIAGMLEPEDRFIVIPCGPRQDKKNVNDLSVNHRAALSDLAFGNIARAEIDLSDLEHANFSRAWDLDRTFHKRFPGHEICHVIGADLIAGGARGESEIQQKWYRGAKVWNKLHFVVQRRMGVHWTEADLPPHCVVVDPSISGSSTEIRERIFNHQPIDDLVSPAVRSYIERHQLFTGRPSENNTRFCDILRPLVIIDPTKTKAAELAEHLQAMHTKTNPNCIVVIGGDGFMLRAIRTHWRKRLPFFGINAGTAGFLLNELTAEKIQKRLLEAVEFKTYTQPMLYAEFTFSDGHTENTVAFNDAWLERTTLQTGWMCVRINNRIKYHLMMGDGALVSTAAGSSGYAKAMGAKPILIGTPAIVFAGSNICSHDWRSAQRSMNDQISLEVLDSQKRPMRGVADGVDFGPVTKMTVRTSKIASVELAFLPETDLAKKHSRKQFPRAS